MSKNGNNIYDSIMLEIEGFKQCGVSPNTIVLAEKDYKEFINFIFSHNLDLSNCYQIDCCKIVLDKNKKHYIHAEIRIDKEQSTYMKELDLKIEKLDEKSKTRLMKIIKKEIDYLLKEMQFDKWYENKKL